MPPTPHSCPGAPLISGRKGIRDVLVNLMVIDSNGLWQSVRCYCANEQRLWGRRACRFQCMAHPRLHYTRTPRGDGLRIRRFKLLSRYLHVFNVCCDQSVRRYMETQPGKINGHFRQPKDNDGCLLRRTGQNEARRNRH